MYAVVNIFKKDDVSDEIRYIKVEGDKLPQLLEREKLDVEFEQDGKVVDIFFFENEEDAEACMGSK